MVKSKKCEECMHYLICKNAKTYKEKIEELLKINNTDDTFTVSIDCKHFKDLPKMSTEI